MPKKGSRGGRPHKQDIEKLVYEDEGRYIATNECAYKLLQLITEMANYKIITVTGPIGDRNKPALIKSRKKIEKEQEAIRKAIEIDESYIFFLRDSEKNPRKYTIRDNRLEEDGEYVVDLEKIERRVVDQKFKDSLKLLFKELNPSMQSILQEFIHIFLASDKTKEQFQKDCIEELEKHPEIYNEIISWDRLYETAYDEKVKLLELDLDLFKKKYEIPERPTQKQSEVEKKRIKVVEREQKVIDQFREQQEEHRPLKLFLDRLQQIIHQHYEL